MVLSTYTRGSVILFFFFFQAEDGIRDYKVTGVQTCALPISRLEPLGVRWLPVERLPPRPEPVEVTGALFPEPHVVLLRLGVDRRLVDERVVRERLRRRKLPVLAKQRLDRNVRLRFRLGHSSPR